MAGDRRRARAGSARAVTEVEAPTGDVEVVAAACRVERHVEGTGTARWRSCQRGDGWPVLHDDAHAVVERVGDHHVALRREGDSARSVDGRGTGRGKPIVLEGRYAGARHRLDGTAHG